MWSLFSDSSFKGCGCDGNNVSCSDGIIYEKGSKFNVESTEFQVGGVLLTLAIISFPGLRRTVLRPGKITIEITFSLFFLSQELFKTDRILCSDSFGWNAT